MTLTSPAEGAIVAGTVTVTAVASDDKGVTRVEFFVDSVSIGVDTTAPYEASWNTTDVPDGAHLVEAVATDTIGQTAEDTSSVTVRNAPVPTKSHVGDLDGRSGPYNSRNWRADVTIAVLDDLGGAVAGATVRGSWSRGSSGTTSCVTNAAGSCGVWRTIANQQTSVRWTVISVSHPTLVYTSSANTDPDGDSNGTEITVRK